MSGIKEAASMKPLFRSRKSRKPTCTSVAMQKCERDVKVLQDAELNSVEEQCSRDSSMSAENVTESTAGKKKVGKYLCSSNTELLSIKIKRKSLDRRTPGRRKKRKNSATVFEPNITTGEQKNDVGPVACTAPIADKSNKLLGCTQTSANFSIGNTITTNQEISWNCLNSLSPRVDGVVSDTDPVASSTPMKLCTLNLIKPPGTCPSVGKRNSVSSSATAGANDCGLDNSSSVCLFDNSSFGRDDSALAAFDLTGFIGSHEDEAISKPVKITELFCVEDKSGSKAKQFNCDYADTEEKVFRGELKKEEKKSHLEGLFDNKLLPGSNSTETKPETTTKSSFYGLPGKVKVLLEQHRGISKLYDWQTDCLNLPALYEGKNLIYSLPTSGGKTLVAEILIMKELLVKQKDAMFILPFVSIVQEKVNSLTQFAVDLGFLVEEYAGSKGKIPPRKRRKKKSLYVATIEKANALVNSLIEENRISEVGLVVVDELHMLGEGGGRGATLETCLAKLLFATETTQIVGMSATLSNINDLKQFLRADVFASDFRPIELCEYFKISSSIYQVKTSKFGHHDEPSHKVVRHVQHHKSKDKHLLIRDPDHLLPLVLEVIPKNSCLVFCPTKKNCQSLVEMLASFMPRELKEVKVAERRELLRALTNQANGLCPTLKSVIAFGMAYHHSGLTMDERKLIEEAYKEGVLCLLTCTSTLAAGVNLPAKRVILRAPYVADSIISRSQYKQMIGRAGRAGIDTSGESILVLKETDKTKIAHLFSGPFDSCKSSLKYEGGKGLRALILNVVGLKLCSMRNDVKSFINCTLLAVQCQEPLQLEEQVSSAIQSLINLGHLREKQLRNGDIVEYKLEVTDLGLATFKGCIDTDATPSLFQDIRRAMAAMGSSTPYSTPDSSYSSPSFSISNMGGLHENQASGGCVDIDSSPVIYEDIKRAQQDLVLSTELHLLYLVTPMDMSASEPNWMVYFKQVTVLNEEDQKAAEIIGVNEGFLSRRATGQRYNKGKINDTVVRRFYLTLMLYKLLRGNTVWNVADTFGVTRGFAQNLLSSASSFASCMVRFTEELKEFWAVKLLLEAMVKKLLYTASIELIPLLEIPGVKQARARQLFRAGYKTLQLVARADTEELIKHIEHLSRKQARQIVSAAKMLLEEKADALREEADEMVS